MRPDTIGNLEDIREAAGFIAEDTRGVTFETFMQDRRIRQLVVHNFLITDEAISRIRRHDPATLAAISEGNLIVDMRNALIHGYDEINYRTVWRTISQSLPVLVGEVERLLSTGEPT